MSRQRFAEAIKGIALISAFIAFLATCATLVSWWDSTWREAIRSIAPAKASRLRERRTRRGTAYRNKMKRYRAKAALEHEQEQVWSRSSRNCL
jgi:hypothetical protein